MNKIIFKGTCTAAITPFTADGINYDALGKQIEYQIENGIDAITILGTTGEAPTISDSEYESIAKFSFDKIAGRVKFILGSGSNCTKKAIEKTHQIKVKSYNLIVHCVCSECLNNKERAN